MAEVWLEIGFGGGEHLVHCAQSRPDVGLIGCEPFEGGVAALLAAVEDRGLANIRVHPEDARPLLRRLAPASVSRVYVLFPDPWPKARHSDRRLLSPEVIGLIAQALADGGLFRFASDADAYVAEVVDALAREPAFGSAAPSRDRPADQGPESRYEARARAGGRVPAYLTCERRAR